MCVLFSSQYGLIPLISRKIIRERGIMRRLVLTLALFVVISGFFMTALPASADLTANLIVGGDFTSGSFTLASGTISLENGIWYKSSDAWTISSLSAMAWNVPAAGDTIRTGYLVQAVNAPTASAGPVELYFNFSTGSTPDYATATLYGSNTQPTYGSYGTQIGSIVLPVNHPLAGPAISETFGGLSYPGYAWYTVLLYGEANYSERIYIDNVSLKVTEGTPVPLPGAVWLLGSALVGLAGMRRFRRK
jgi:hypothetical protein